MKKKQNAKKSKKSPNTTLISNEENEEFNVIGSKKIKEMKFSKVNITEYQRPEWMANPLDKNKLSPNDPFYNPSTLHIPEREMKKLSPMFRQFWEIKKENFDKIIFFKFSDSYFCFYDDAIVCLKYIPELKSVGMYTNNPFVIVYDKYFEVSVDRLTSIGYKIVLVEQLDKSILDGSIIKREKAVIISRGSYLLQYSKENESHHFLSIKNGDHNSFVVCSFDFVEKKFRFSINPDFDETLDLIFKINPLEIIYDQNFSQDYRSTIKAYTNFTMTELRLDQFSKIELENESKKFIEKYSIKMNLPNFWSTKGNLETFRSIIMWIIELGYEKILTNSEVLESNLISHKCLIIDSSAYFHLNILPNKNKSILPELSLLEIFEKPKTNFGNSKLVEWLKRPLFLPKDIYERREMISELSNKGKIVENFNRGLMKVSNIDQDFLRLFFDGKKKYSNNFSTLKMEEINTFKCKLDIIVSLFKSSSNFSSNIESNALKNLFDLKIGDSKIFPKIIELQQFLENSIEMKNKMTLPKKGSYEPFDKISEKIEKSQIELSNYLIQVQNEFGNNDISFFHSRSKFQLEVPEKLISKIPETFSIMSQRKGFKRYYTPFIEEKTNLLDHYENHLQEIIFPFVNFLIEKISYFNDEFKILFSVAGELDALISLCKSNQKNNWKTIPIFSTGKFAFKNFIHPLLKILNENYVSNNLDIKEKEKLLVLTGPNMGGKSSILRAICLNVIMAQIGLNLPCEFAEFEPRDRIFCRIGAGDRLVHGKSTLYIELEETKRILKFATDKSLSVVDELGRGTSTFDGISIAYAFIKFVIEKKKGIIFFSTHLFSLLDDFKFHDNIKFYYMDFVFMDEYEKYKKIKFLYKLREGKIDDSYANNVASLAGIPDYIILKAKEKRNEFEIINKFISILRY